MGLSQLLAVGRSVRTIKDGPARYKMSQRYLLPKFGGQKAAEPRAAGTVRLPADAAPEPARPEPSASAAVATEAVLEEREPAPAKSAALVKAVKMLRPFGSWSLFKNPFGQFLAREARTAPRQTEMLLDSVKPMRNDLTNRP